MMRPWAVSRIPFGKARDWLAPRSVAHSPHRFEWRPAKTSDRQRSLAAEFDTLLLWRLSAKRPL